MKKLLFLFIVACCSSCTTSIGEVDGTTYFDFIRHYEYRKHKYIIFGMGHKAGIVHDPECPCYYSHKFNYD